MRTLVALALLVAPLGGDDQPITVRGRVTLLPQPPPHATPPAAWDGRIRVRTVLRSRTVADAWVPLVAGTFELAAPRGARLRVDLADVDGLGPVRAESTVDLPVAAEVEVLMPEPVHVAVPVLDGRTRAPATDLEVLRERGRELPRDPSWELGGVWTSVTPPPEPERRVAVDQDASPLRLPATHEPIRYWVRAPGTPWRAIVVQAGAAPGTGRRQVLGMEARWAPEGVETEPVVLGVAAATLVVRIEDLPHEPCGLFLYEDCVLSGSSGGFGGRRTATALGGRRELVFEGLAPGPWWVELVHLEEHFASEGDPVGAVLGPDTRTTLVVSGLPRRARAPTLRPSPASPLSRSPSERFTVLLVRDGERLRGADLDALRGTEVLLGDELGVQVDDRAYFTVLEAGSRLLFVSPPDGFWPLAPRYVDVAPCGLLEVELEPVE